MERIDTDGVSALRWGSEAPRVVFLHGGAQNAHTWDTVVLGLGEPALAVDLPGHGRSAWRDDGDYSPSATPTPSPRCCANWRRTPNWWSACRWAG